MLVVVRRLFFTESPAVTMRFRQTFSRKVWASQPLFGAAGELIQFVVRGLGDSEPARNSYALPFWLKPYCARS